MQPVYTKSDRRRRYCLPVLLLLAGSVLWALLPASVGPASADDAPGAYRNLPIYAKDWTRVRNLPDGPQRVAREQSRQAEYQRRWHAIHQLVGGQHLSKKSQDILAKRGLGPALLSGEAADGAGKAWSGVDTLSVLVIRIGFEDNREPDLTTIDPGGDFLLVPPAEADSLFIDPPPRNRSFYEAHLAGLSEYYKFQSGGRLHIDGHVLPTGQDDSYKLSDVADYGPGRDGFWTLEGLERLVRDIMVEADEGTTADGEFSMADYDDDNPFTYIIFVHAGSDWQSDIYGDSPNDIPTFFVTLGESQPLPASGGSLTECSIIPETTNQDDSPGSIAAAFYHEFGHALGLVDVYNTQTGLPSVGVWDLMDSGTNLPVTLGYVTAENDTIVSVATGVLPPSLSAWNKWFLGWIDVAQLTGTEEELTLPAIQVPRTASGYQVWDLTTGNFLPMGKHPQAYQAGLSSREYFLLENRYVPPEPSATSTFTPFEALSFERDEATGVIMYLAGLYQNAWGNSGMYDYFMPAGGLLTWHVNMDRIEANLSDNTINAYGDGLRLVEADGIQDIGVLDAYVLGWYGSWRDPFTDEYGQQDLFADDFPGSRCFDRSWTGLSLTNVRRDQPDNTSVLRFGAALEPLATGFPYEVRDEFQSGGEWTGPWGMRPESPVTVQTADGPSFVFAEREPTNWTGGDFPPALVGLNGDGTATWYNRFVDGPLGTFQTLDAPLAGSLALQDLPSGESGLLWGTVRGTVGLTRIPASGDPQVLWSRDVTDSLTYGPLPLDLPALTAFCLLDPDTVVVLDDTGEDAGLRASLSGYPDASGAPPVSAPRLFEINGMAFAAVVTAGEVFVLTLDEAMNTLPLTLFEHLPLSRPLADGPVHTAAVPDGNVTWLMVFDTDGLVGNWGLSLGDDTLLGADITLEAALVCEPAVADVDGDGTHDLVLATGTRIHALHPDGVAVRGFPSRLYELFPLPDTTGIVGPVIVADATGDGVNDLFYTTDAGHLIGLNATGRLMPGTPFRFGDHQAAGLAVGEGADGPDSRVLWLMSSGGYTGPPLDRQQINGKVSAYQLANVKSGARTSEWLGTAGGSRRAGPEGLPTDLGEVAPAAAESGRVVLYPNPAHADEVTVRFFAGHPGVARFQLYNIQGEPVGETQSTVTPDAINELRLDISGVGSGLYLGRLAVPGASGSDLKTMTLAVER